MLRPDPARVGISGGEDVADRAVVGIATLYGRFPTREDLIAACFERRLEEYLRAAEEALNAPDGWTGFAAYVEQICSMQAADSGLAVPHSNWIVPAQGNHSAAWR